MPLDPPLGHDDGDMKKPDPSQQEISDGRCYLILSTHLELRRIAQIAGVSETEVKRCMALAKQAPK